MGSSGCGCNNGGRNRPSREEVIVCPTKTVVNTRTNHRNVKYVHPTEVINVHKTIVRNRHSFPVSERDVYETVEENENIGRGRNRRYNDGNGNGRFFY
ncbi:CotD family spore coat protein [Cytobacillus purgationiresistens]|uniref:Spore coat protein D n=1 Tax=Cytobacillus purgationiresistens TaxID=863449 RepID=A0ABU0APS3_9BACI|nr:CotD family spore coat protein [Cytobacillus purgationiresistens]MDQ0273284.1 spore coat protein D [Cytobacillus purgationiresistens]